MRENTTMGPDTRARWRRWFISARSHRIADSSVNWRERIWVLALFPAAIILSLIASAAPATVEAVYSRGVYVAIAGSLSFFTGWLPLSLAEALIGLGLLWGLWRVGRAIAYASNHARSVRNLAKHALARLLSAFSVIVFLFVLCWGLNYHRKPLADSLGLALQPASTEELEATCEELVGYANTLRDSLPEDSRGVVRLVDGGGEALNRSRAGYDALGETHHFVSSFIGSPKFVLFSPVMSIFGVSGVYFPFTSEANINGTLPDPALPFIACHELAHQQGFAREDEANFLGYLACRGHPDLDFNYSGMLTASRYAVNALASVNSEAAARVEKRFSDGVRRDLAALAEWSRAWKGPLADLGRGVNHAYLVANGESDGVNSYGRMVDLILADRRARARK